MKKGIVWMLVWVLVLSLVACKDTSAAGKVKAYVQVNGEALAQSMEKSFSASGPGCETTVKAEGTGIVIQVCIDGMDAVADTQKEEIQNAYDSLSDLYDSVLAGVQKEVPEVTYLTIRVCEEDGDSIATIQIGQK